MDKNGQSRRSKKTLGQVLSSARRERGLTLREVSEACGFSVSSLNRIEHDLVRSPSPEKLVELAMHLNLETDKLLSLSGWPSHLVDGRKIRVRTVSVFDGKEISDDEAKELRRYLGVLRGKWKGR